MSSHSSFESSLQTSRGTCEHFGAFLQTCSLSGVQINSGIFVQSSVSTFSQMAMVSFRQFSCFSTTLHSLRGIGPHFFSAISSHSRTSMVLQILFGLFSHFSTSAHTFFGGFSSKTTHLSKNVHFGHPTWNACFDVITNLL